MLPLQFKLSYPHLSTIRTYAWALVICWIGCSKHSSIIVDDATRMFSIDVSPKNVERVIGGSGFYAGMNTLTSSSDESISRDRLASLLEDVHGDCPHLVIVSSVKENWVFYIAHNGKSRTEVILHLLAEGGVILNGDVHTDPFDLPPGAHGFRVVSQDGPVLVEHVFVPQQ